MQTLLIEIPIELFAPAESSHFEGDYTLPALKAGPDLYSFDEPLTWRIDITNTGDALLVTGVVEGDARTSCCRCLEPVDIPFVGEIEGFFLLSDQAGICDDADEGDYEVLGEDHKIDLAALIYAALLLEAPLVPLCDDDCKGICQMCGANLNEGACSCSALRENEQLDASPFAALKDLKLD